MRFVIGGLQKTSLLDFPKKIACIVFSCACNFRCGYCHNPELSNLSDGVMTTDDFFAFLKTRVGKLDGVVVTGGEPTLQPDLYDFIKEIKNLGFAVKLDTNGSNPDLLKRLVNDNLIDYVAMDIKSPLNRYQEVTNSKISTDKIQESIDFLLSDNVDYEFRTTVVKGQLNLDDFEEISKLIKGAKRYFLQKFEPSKTLDKTFMIKTSYTIEEFEEIKKVLEKNIDYVEVRK